MARRYRSFKDLFKTFLFSNLDKLCDAAVISEDGVEFKVHKLFLSKGSEYFHAFFRGNIGEVHNKVTLMLDCKTLEKVLIFLYTGDIVLNKHNVAELAIAADFLLIDALLMKCRDFALNKISLDSCMALLCVAQVVERLQIKDHCFRFVEVHFERLVAERNLDIAELPFDVFRQLLRSDSLRVTYEGIVWKAVVTWVQGNDSATLMHVSDLLSYLRWNDANDWLTSCIALHPVFKDNEFYKNMNLKELVKTWQNGTGSRSASSNRFPQQMYVFICRKPSTSSGIEIFLTYDGQLDIWRKIGETDDYFHIVAVVGRFLTLFNNFSNSRRVFELINKTWSNKNVLISTQHAYLVVPGKSGIFVIGGFVFIFNTTLSKVEYYDPSTDLWSHCIPVPLVTICGACVITNKLYVVGYNQNSELLEMKALFYDYSHQVWYDIEKPKHFRTSFAFFNFGERLYMLGGQTRDRDVTRRVEVYYPEENDWKDFPDLPLPYQLPHAIVLKNKLMIYDDCPGVSISRFSPCTWNDETQMWEVEDVFSAFNEIHRYQFCCIEDQTILQELAKENKDPKTVWTKTPFA